MSTELLLQTLSWHAWHSGEDAKVSTAAEHTALDAKTCGTILAMVWTYRIGCQILWYCLVMV